MKFVAFLLSLVLLASIVVPTEIVAQETNQTSSIGEESVGVTDKIDVATSETVKQGSEEELSSLIHGAILLFKQQRAETINAIKECRENIQNASPENRHQAREDCKVSLNQIKESYKEMRDQIKELFKEQRETVKMLIKEAKTSLTENNMAIQAESDQKDTDESDQKDTPK